MSTTTSTSPRNKWIRWGSFAAVVLLPLAFAGLFVASLGQGNKALDNIPVAIVNQDTLQQIPKPDGTIQNVFAGRQLVTELTGSKGFNWTITNESQAAADLKDGKVYAILTVPSDFSTSILSLTGSNPVKANISIKTDDSHSYLTGSVAQVVGQTMTDTFGKAITAQYIGGIYASIGSLGSALSTAADGATQLSGGAASLSSGLSQYTGGVDSLSYGLSKLNDGAAGLSGLNSGISGYTAGVSQLSGTLASINGALQATTTDPVVAGTLQAVVDGLAKASAGGQTLSSQAASGIAGVQSGISQSADGAAQLSYGSSSLVSGANSLASGAGSLASGLQTGAAKIPAVDAATATKTAEIAADPVTLTVSTANPVTQVGQVVATFAVFLVLRPVTRRALTSTARSGRLVASAIFRASLVTASQAVLLVALLHLVVGVSWALLPATLLFSLITALAFTAFHYLLTIWLGRAGLVVSLFVLAVQMTSTGGIYPIELLSKPFQLVSPFLPLTYAVDGMQGIIAGGNPAGVVGSALTLLAFGVGSTVLALFAIRRTRRASALGLVPSSI